MYGGRRCHVSPSSNAPNQKKIMAQALMWVSAYHHCTSWYSSTRYYSSTVYSFWPQYIVPHVAEQSCPTTIFRMTTVDNDDNSLSTLDMPSLTHSHPLRSRSYQHCPLFCIHEKQRQVLDSVAISNAMIKSLFPAGVCH